jgi:hypothetical protein
MLNKDLRPVARINPELQSNCFDTIDGIASNNPSQVPPFDIHFTKSYNLTPWSNPVNIWYTYHGIKMVNEMRECYEQINGVYDLIIKGRPDTGIDRDIDFKRTYSKKFYKSIVFIFIINDVFKNIR